MKEIIVLIGNYGSGKTELALNFAFRAARRGKTLLIDLDMVNTYFRLTERRDLIDAREIRLISPNYVSTNVESLSLPADVSTAFHADWDTVVFDVGGDPAGATALGRFRSDFEGVRRNDLHVLNVVNVRRPMSGTGEKIIALMDELSEKSRLSVTGLINNTNLAVMTGPDELRDGYHTLREVSEKTGIPVSYTTGRRDLLNSFLATNPDPLYVGTPMEIDTYMRRDWESFVKSV